MTLNFEFEITVRDVAQAWNYNECLYVSPIFPSFVSNHNAANKEI